MPVVLQKSVRTYAKKNETAPQFEIQPYNQATWSEQLESVIVGVQTTSFGAVDITIEACLAILNDYENAGACIKFYSIVKHSNSTNYNLIFTLQSRTAVIP